jgi:hypothetical protein
LPRARKKNARQSLRRSAKKRIPVVSGSIRVRANTN